MIESLPAFRPCARHLRIIGVICVASCLGLPRQSPAVELRDDLGRKVELKAPAQRIVTLAPYLTELVYSAGAGAALVGVSAHSDFPPEAKALPQVGGAMGPEFEAIAALRPDIVLAWQDNIRAADIERLERLGARVVVTGARTLDDVARLLAAIGSLTGRDVSEPVRRYRERIAKARAEFSGRPRVRVFVEIWHRPLTTIGGTHWINAALEICGGENVFRDLRAVAPVVSWEDLYARDPRLVLGTGSGGGEQEFRAAWADRGSLPAVAAGRLAYVPADYLQRPTLRLADGVMRVCSALERVRSS